MDDPGISWPYWKFGMRKDDLFTTLATDYNTFPSSIQDPEAFHHDVWELSNEASTTEQFHRLMSLRKEQRMRELNDLLENAAIEIIANPAFIGTEQWQHAVQLFRTRSLDSLVRYFASYLPYDNPWHNRSDSSSMFSSDSESVSADSSADESDHHSFSDEKIIMTHEPRSIEEARQKKTTNSTSPKKLPPSPPRSTTTTTSSKDSVAHGFILTPRTMSFSSESESDHIPSKEAIPHLHHHRRDSASDTDGSTPISSVSDSSETQHQHEFLAEPFEEQHVSILDDDEHMPYTGSQFMDDDDDDTPSPFESETPTPKPKVEAGPSPLAGGASFFETRPSPLTSAATFCYRRSESSPTRTHLSSHAASHAASSPLIECSRQLLSSARASARRRDLSPLGKSRRSLPSSSCCSSGRIQKPGSGSTEAFRSRPRERRRGGDDGC